MKQIGIEVRVSFKRDTPTLTPHIAHSYVLIKQTRRSAIAERPHCRVRYSFHQK